MIEPDNNTIESEQPLQLDRRDFEALQAGLGSSDPEVAKRFGERLLRLARSRPELLIPYAEELAKLGAQASTQAREVSLDALGLVARVAPGTVAYLLPRLHDILAAEPLNLVRDRAIEILGTYAASSKQAAEKVYPMLSEAFEKYGTKNPLVKKLMEVMRKGEGT